MRGGHHRRRSRLCAGQDLEGRDPRGADAPYDLGQTLAHYYNPMVRAIRALEKPVICAVNGVAAGAGANIAFACDIVIASASAKFIQSFAKVGLIPDAGGTHSLVHLIGPMRAKALAMTASAWAHTACEWDWFGLFMMMRALNKKPTG